MPIFHGFHQKYRACQNPAERGNLLLSILEDNLGMTKAEICLSSGYKKATLSHYQNDRPGSDNFARGLRQVLEQQLHNVKVMGTCAPLTELDEDDLLSIQLELATVARHPRESTRVQLPDKVAGVWGTFGVGGADVFVLVVLPNVSPGVIAHELEELADYYRQKATSHPPTPVKRKSMF